LSRRRKLKQLAWREYLPMLATIATWAVIVAAIGHADTARLLAAVTAIRATQLLTKLATPSALKRRAKATREVRRQAKRYAFALQAGALLAALILVALIAEGLKAIGQGEVAAFLPFLALGMPARYWRFADVRTASPFSRLALGVSGLIMVLVAWGAGWQAAALGLAFATREWIAYFAMRWWPYEEGPSKFDIREPLRFPEVARYTAILGRRLLTYRLTKSLLAVFGPLGNVAARTGRGLNWHQKAERHVPHHLGGFILFFLGAIGAALFLAIRSGEPAAMVGAAGLLQVGFAAANVILVWRYLPKRDGEPLPEEDDDDD
jgi:hypothetical protein